MLTESNNAAVGGELSFPATGPNWIPEEAALQAQSALGRKILQDKYRVVLALMQVSLHGTMQHH